MSELVREQQEPHSENSATDNLPYKVETAREEAAGDDLEYFYSCE